MMTHQVVAVARVDTGRPAIDPSHPNRVGGAHTCRSPVPSTAGRRLGRRRAPSTENSFALALAPREPAFCARAARCMARCERAMVSGSERLALALVAHRLVSGDPHSRPSRRTAPGGRPCNALLRCSDVRPLAAPRGWTANRRDHRQVSVFHGQGSVAASTAMDSRGGIRPSGVTPGWLRQSRRRRAQDGGRRDRGSAIRTRHSRAGRGASPIRSRTCKPALSGAQRRRSAAPAPAAEPPPYLCRSCARAGLGGSRAGSRGGVRRVPCRVQQARADGSAVTTWRGRGAGEAAAPQSARVCAAPIASTTPPRWRAPLGVASASPLSAP